MARLGELGAELLRRPLRALWRRGPWWRVAIVALPLLAVLALLGPVIDLFAVAVAFVDGVLGPVVATPGGRLLLLNLVLGAAVLLVLLGLRSAWRRLRTDLALRAHDRGIAAMVAGRGVEAEAAFRRVVRSSAQPPSAYPALVADARLQLVRVALARGDLAAAERELGGVRPGDLQGELARVYAQLRTEVLLRGDHLPATVERHVRASLRDFDDDEILLGALRELLVVRGELGEACAVQRRRVEVSAPRARPAAERQLHADLIAWGRHALAAGDAAAATAAAQEAARVDPESPEPGCLLGDVALAGGNPRAAIRAYGRTRSQLGLERIGEVLEAEPDAVTARELLEACPIDGALLLVARVCALRGERRRAVRAARMAWERLGPTPAALTVLADVWRLLGEAERAEALLRSGASALFLREPVHTAPAIELDTGG